MSRIVRLPHLVLMLASLALLGAWQSDAEAHARLRSASPPADATVQSGLAEIRLVFNETVEPSFSTVELLDEAGEVLATSQGQTICEAQVCTLTIEPLASGSYGVRYHVLSADGHVVEGSHGFNVAD